ncbi:MAG: hypothetical protein EBT08_19535, partial [Betaproteobacteria bacterium]|nr:hypothetical protein [Betaproteobacteria bacterium]
GSASSDANGDALTFSWTLTGKPNGSAAVLASENSAAPTFLADVAGTYVASLIVNDGKVNSITATGTVTATVANAAPVANAGVAQNVTTGTIVTLNGSASSDANGDALTFSWTLTAKPNGSAAVLAGVNSAVPTFLADIAGTYVASLIVNDGKVNSSTATGTVTATIIAAGTSFDGLVTSLDGIANSNTFNRDPTKVIVSTSPTQLTVRLEQYFDGTCIYTANLNAARNSVQQGSYQCSDFSTGTWDLLSMKRVESADLFVKLRKDGASIKRAYGMSSSLAAAARTLPAPISSLVGTYEGIGTGAAFSTIPTTIAVALNSTTVSLVITRSPSDTCRYTATLQPNGLSVMGGTYSCSDFTAGTWSLLDMRSVDGSDLYVALQLDNRIQRAYGLK